MRPVPLRHVRHRVPQGAPRRRLRRLPRPAVPADRRPQAGDRRGRRPRDEPARSSGASSAAILIGDVLNALGYRIRPYEVEPGATDRALESARRSSRDAFEKQQRRCRRALQGPQDHRRGRRSTAPRAKPKVGIIGEFWAMTTEGDGNYHLQRFLEGEGAEPDIQLVDRVAPLHASGRAATTRSERARPARRRRRRSTASKRPRRASTSRKRMAIAAGRRDRRCAGCSRPSRTRSASTTTTCRTWTRSPRSAHEFYDNNLRGGEGHMEVGKLIQNVAHSKAHMTLR